MNGKNIPKKYTNAKKKRETGMTALLLDRMDFF